MKKILNLIFRLLPSLFVVLGLVIMIGSVGSEEFSVVCGKPIECTYRPWFGLALFGIGCVWNRIRNEYKNIRRNKR